MPPTELNPLGSDAENVTRGSNLSAGSKKHMSHEPGQTA